MITSSTFALGPVQADGRVPITERHVQDDGTAYTYEWLHDGTLDPQMVLDERAAFINATLAAREAARLAVVGTSVPLTRHDFKMRLTAAERIAIRERAKTDPVVEDFMDILNTSGLVYYALALPGLQYLHFVAGILTAERFAIASEPW